MSGGKLDSERYHVTPRFVPPIAIPATAYNSTLWDPSDDEDSGESYTFSDGPTKAIHSESESKDIHRPPDINRNSTSSRAGTAEAVSSGQGADIEVSSDEHTWRRSLTQLVGFGTELSGEASVTTSQRSDDAKSTTSHSLSASLPVRQKTIHRGRTHASKAPGSHPDVPDGSCGRAPQEAVVSPMALLSKTLHMKMEQEYFGKENATVSDHYRARGPGQNHHNRTYGTGQGYFPQWSSNSAMLSTDQSGDGPELPEQDSGRTPSATASKKRKLESSSPSDRRGYPCVFHGQPEGRPDPTVHCQKRQIYVSSLRKHHEAQAHEFRFLYCIVCFAQFDTPAARSEHEARSCRSFRCVTLGCPNFGTQPSTVCLHGRNNSQTAQWQQLFRMARPGEPVPDPDADDTYEEEPDHDDSFDFSHQRSRPVTPSRQFRLRRLSDQVPLRTGSNQRNAVVPNDNEDTLPFQLLKIGRRLGDIGVSIIQIGTCEADPGMVLPRSLHDTIERLVTELERLTSDRAQNFRQTREQTRLRPPTAMSRSVSDQGLPLPHLSTQDTSSLVQLRSSSTNPTLQDFCQLTPQALNINGGLLITTQNHLDVSPTDPPIIFTRPTMPISNIDQPPTYLPFTQIVSGDAPRGTEQHQPILFWDNSDQAGSIHITEQTKKEQTTPEDGDSRPEQSVSYLKLLD